MLVVNFGLHFFLFYVFSRKLDVVSYVHFAISYGLHWFLLNLIATKLCVVSNVHFPVLDIFCMRFELNCSLHLKNYGSYFEAF